MDKSCQELIKVLLSAFQRNPPKEWGFSDGRRPDKNTGRIFIDQELQPAFGSAPWFLGGTEESFLTSARKDGLDIKRLHEAFEAAKTRPADG